MSLEWLQLSAKGRRVAPEKPYTLKAKSGADSKDEVKTEEQPGQKRSIKTEEEEEISHKKQKDSQKAGSKSLTIPVDGCFVMYCPKYKSKQAVIFNSQHGWFVDFDCRSRRLH